MHIFQRFGEMTEAGFQQRALCHGLDVSKPVGAVEPYDFLAGILSRNWRIQVKCILRLLPNGMYQVCVGRSVRGPNGGRISVPYSRDEVDFFAISLIPENSWYIVPREMVDGRCSLYIHARNHRKAGPWLPYFEAWDLLRQTGEYPVLPEAQSNYPSPLRKRLGRREEAAVIDYSI